MERGLQAERLAAMGQMMAVLTHESRNLLQLCQVNLEMLENSIAACCDPVQLSIIWSESPCNGQSEIVISLRDNGPGLSLEQKRRAFEPFFTTKKGGTGLGLAISRSIIEAHGGRIEIASNEHSGAEFLITLPRHTNSSPTFNDVQASQP